MGICETPSKKSITSEAIDQLTDIATSISLLSDSPLNTVILPTETNLQWLISIRVPTTPKIKINK